MKFHQKFFSSKRNLKMMYKATDQEKKGNIKAFNPQYIKDSYQFMIKKIKKN